MRTIAVGTFLAACTVISGWSLDATTQALAADRIAPSAKFAPRGPNYSPRLARASMARRSALQPTEAEPAAEVMSELPIATDSQIVSDGPVVSDRPLVIDGREVVPAPQGEFQGPFKSAENEDDADRFHRALGAVPIDIRPTEGAMPTDLAATELDKRAHTDLRDTEGWGDTLVAYSPWTICYRPLYFEEVPLERYGQTLGLVQPVVSGIHFFGSVAALPYKMTVHRPRSCVCSNGFSRIGDIPLGDYGKPQFRLDASLVEAAAVTGFIFILP